MLIVAHGFPDDDGFDFIRERRSGKPASKVIVFSMSPAIWPIRRAMAAGSNACFCRVDALKSLAQAFEVVLAGEVCYSLRARQE